MAAESEAPAVVALRPGRRSTTPTSGTVPNYTGSAAPSSSRLASLTAWAAD